MTSTATETKTITLQINVPIQIELDVENTTDQAILDAAWNDLKDEDSSNDWEQSWDAMKSVLRYPQQVQQIDEAFYVVD
nr:hypothetical protein 16 [bacterium]